MTSNNENLYPGVIADDIARILSQAQAIFDNQILFGQTAYMIDAEPEEMITTRNAATLAANGTTADDAKRLTVARDWEYCDSLELLRDAIRDCRECPLGDTRANFVFGSGNPNADVMIIGEAPGAEEDAQGLPFVGAAGQLLTKILAAIGFNRDEVYIANILKCRPPGNRAPTKSETDKCEPYLHRQIEIIQPKFILALGLTAADTLLKTQNKMADIRGKVFDYRGVAMLVTYHPAALLRNPNWKVAAWEDVKLLRRMYDEWKEKTPIP